MKQRIKNLIRPAYRFTRYTILRFMVRRQFSAYKSTENLTVERISPQKISFFGYYNVSPENTEGQVLFCSPIADTDSVALYYHDGDNETLIGETRAHNWQQGCMSQWGYTNTTRAYYNRYNQSTGSYECAIFDTDKNCEIDSLPMPINALSKQEDFALSLNYERLALMRPDYGYFCNKNIKLPSNDNDGIWHIDIATKETRLIISLQQLIDIKPVDTMAGAQHKVNHIDIAPDGKRFMFLHRWVGPKGRFMRLITANADGSDIYILNGDKMTSHSYWTDSNHIVSFCHTLETGDAYVMFEDKTPHHKTLSSQLPTTDGHPSTINNGEWMITDTYPDKAAMSRLYLYHIPTDRLITLGRFFQPLKFQGTGRIDLHPKWNMAGDKVYFESGHNGKRCLYSINVSSLIK